jgi:peptidoglycan hydrolase-like protein with peptidoglycan-binding domain
MTDYPNRTIRQGSNDMTAVDAIRQRLAELHHEIGNGPGFDAELTAAVKAFQSRNVDQHGQNLLIDGKVGPLTWAALFNAPAPQTRATGSNLLSVALQIARSQVGVLETPRNSNRGPEVDSYLAAVGLPPGHPWCAAFVYWCLQRASQQTGEANDCARTGGVLRQWALAGEAGIERITATRARNDPALVRPGMVFVMDHGRGLGHTGFVYRTVGARFDTIEGNTDASRTREGGGVYALTRKVGEINCGYIAYG